VQQFAGTDPWPGAWRFRAAQGPPDVVRGVAYPVSALLMAGDKGIRLVVRVANGIPLVDVGKWKVSVGGLADARAAGFRVERLRGDTFLVAPDAPEAALRFMGCLMERDVLTVSEKTWTVQVPLAPPESGTDRLPAAITSPGWHRLPWLEPPEAHPGVRCAAWMKEALRTFLPQPDRSPHFEIFPA
jgi:hypothetical protein